MEQKCKAKMKKKKKFSKYLFFSFSLLSYFKLISVEIRRKRRSYTVIGLTLFQRGHKKLLIAGSLFAFLQRVPKRKVLH